MIYLAMTATGLWLFASCAVGILISPFRWRSMSLNVDVGRLFSKPALWLCGWRMELENTDQIEAHQPCVYVANHQSMMDMATFGSVFPHRTVVIGKRELLWIPFFGLYMWVSRNVFINRQKRNRAFASISAAVDAIKGRGVSIWIFPEGTRNRTDQLLQPFKKGAFYMAVEAQVPVVPVVCAPLKPLLNWPERRLRKGSLRLRVLPPVSTVGLTQADVEGLADRVREQMLEAIRGLSS